MVSRYSFTAMGASIHSDAGCFQSQVLGKRALAGGQKPRSPLADASAWDVWYRTTRLASPFNADHGGSLVDALTPRPPSRPASRGEPLVSGWQ